VDGKPVAEALTLDKGTVSLTHSWTRSHQIHISDAGNSCGTSFGRTEVKPLPFGTAQPWTSAARADFNLR
jgi:alpha-amylase